MTDTTKVLLEVNGGSVSVQVLEEQGGGPHAQAL